MTIATMMDRGGDATPFFIRSSRYDRHEFMTTSETNGPLWTQDQAIAYEAALEAINDVIAGYSAQIAIERNASPPNIHRMEWLRMRVRQARDVAESLDVTDRSEELRVGKGGVRRCRCRGSP